ncbi:unnamed protein product, partial [Rotaria sordida]
MLHNSWRQSFNIRHLCIRELTIDEVLKRFTDYRRPAMIVDASLKQSHHDQSSSLNINQEFVNESEDDDEYNYNHLSITSLSTIDQSCYNSNFTGSNEISYSEKLSLTQQHEDELDTTKEDKEPCSIVKRK